ncbi:MAG: hypothetical protein M1831_000221 [Alyxoria varia]|nr:MAG: hypothetical protein M1831_000221 [Alyxoria varia]
MAPVAVYSDSPVTRGDSSGNDGSSRPGADGDGRSAPKLRDGDGSSSLKPRHDDDGSSSLEPRDDGDDDEKLSSERDDGDGKSSKCPGHGSDEPTLVSYNTTAEELSAEGIDRRDWAFELKDALNVEGSFAESEAAATTASAGGYNGEGGNDVEVESAVSSSHEVAADEAKKEDPTTDSTVPALETVSEAPQIVSTTNTPSSSAAAALPSPTRKLPHTRPLRSYHVRSKSSIKYTPPGIKPPPPPPPYDPTPATLSQPAMPSPPLSPGIPFRAPPPPKPLHGRHATTSASASTLDSVSGSPVSPRSVANCSISPTFSSTSASSSLNPPVSPQQFPVQPSKRIGEKQDLSHPPGYAQNPLAVADLPPCPSDADDSVLRLSNEGPILGMSPARRAVQLSKNGPSSHRRAVSLSASQAAAPRAREIGAWSRFGASSEEESWERRERARRARFEEGDGSVSETAEEVWGLVKEFMGPAARKMAEVEGGVWKKVNGKTT